MKLRIIIIYIIIFFIGCSEPGNFSRSDKKVNKKNEIDQSRFINKSIQGGMITWNQDPGQNKTYFYNDGDLLAVYNNKYNTWTEFYVKDGRNYRNIIGGFSDSVGKGHDSYYPYGHPAGSTTKIKWEGFWAGFNYYDDIFKSWIGINGNPDAEQSFTVTSIMDNLVDVHVETKVDFLFWTVFECDVHYYLSTYGIGVSNKIKFKATIYPYGYHDTGGQLIMTQVDCDFDPSLSNANQKSLYFKLAADKNAYLLDPFSPYGGLTPSNTWTDITIPSYWETPLSNTALVNERCISYFTPYERLDSNVNLALRVDMKNSKLPDLEYYCEYNGEHDYLNFLYSPAIGKNRTQKSIPAGTEWILYGDFIVWEGDDPEILNSVPLQVDVGEHPLNP